MCEASKYPRRYSERFPYTQEILQILKSPKYELEYSPQDLKGIDYHLKLERYLFKNVLDFTTNSITFTYCEKEHNSYNYPSIYIEDLATAFNSDIVFSSVTQKAEVLFPSEQAPKPSLMGRKQHYSLTELALFKLCPKLYYHWESSNNESAYLSKIQLKFYFEAILFCDLFDRFMAYNLENRKVYQKESNEYQAIIKSLWNDCAKYHSQYFSFFNEYEKQDTYRNIIQKVCSSVENSIQYVKGQRYTIISYSNKEYCGSDYTLTVEHDNRFVDYDYKRWRMSQNSTYLHFLVLKTTDGKSEIKHYSEMIDALDRNDPNEDRINLVSRIIAKINIQFDSGRFIHDGVARTDALVSEISDYNFANAKAMSSEYCRYCRYSETCLGI